MADERYPADHSGDTTGDATQPLSEAGPAPDATTPMAPLGSTEQFPGPVQDGPATPGAGAAPTAAMPPVDADADGDTPRWSARAPVRPGGPVQEWRAEEPVPDPYEGRSWFTPILVGGLALLLLAMLGTGIWLIYHNSRDRSAPTPGAPVSASATPSASPSPTPTTASPTRSAAPTTSAAPAGIPVPPLVGASEADAVAILDGLGLAHRVTRQPDGTVAPGTVLSTNPPAGTPVPKGGVVTLVVASAPPVATTRSPSPTASRSGP